MLAERGRSGAAEPGQAEPFRLTPRALVALIVEAVNAFLEDRAMSRGAAIAFYTLFSLAPILLVVVGIAGVVFGRDAAEGAMFGELSRLVGPQGANAVQSMLVSAEKTGSGLFASLFGLALIVIAATIVVAELQDALNVIWRAPPTTASGFVALIRARVISLAVIIGMGFLLLVSLALNAAVTAFGDWLNAVVPGLELLIQLANLLLSYVITVLLFAMIFKVLPDARIAWRDVWVAALVTAVLFNIGKVLIGIYIGSSAVASGYGAAGALVVVLVWVYYSAQILLFGAEFTRIYAARHGSHAQGGENADPEPEP